MRGYVTLATVVAAIQSFADNLRVVGSSAGAVLQTVSADDYEDGIFCPGALPPLYDPRPSSSRTKGAAFTNAKNAVHKRDRKRLERERQRALAGRR